MLPGPRMRPVQMRIQHGSHAALHRLDSPRQQALEILDRTRGPGPEVAARGRLGDAGVVGGRGEGDVEVVVCGFGA